MTWKMCRNRRSTRDPAQRAADIADREVELALQREPDCNFIELWFDIESQVRKELCQAPD